MNQTIHEREPPGDDHRAKQGRRERRRENGLNSEPNARWAIRRKAAAQKEIEGIRGFEDLVAAFQNKTASDSAFQRFLSTAASGGLLSETSVRSCDRYKVLGILRRAISR